MSAQTHNRLVLSALASMIAPVATVATLLSAAGEASAQCSVYRRFIPDFDQRRDAAFGIPGLPNGGSMYCVPTSATNWMGYIANNGYPAVLNGPRDWDAPANYNFVTNMIGLMGQVMNTDPAGGTGGTDHRVGAQTWLDSFYPGQFVVSRFGSNGALGPSISSLYQKMSAGALINITLGRYSARPANVPVPGFPARFVRTGGHVMSLSRVYDSCSTTPTLFYRDPATGGGNATTTQSTFVSNSSDMQMIPGLWAGDDVTPPVARTMWRYADASGLAILDAFTAICPMFGLTAGAQQGEISVLGSGMLNELSLANIPQTTHSPNRDPIVAILVEPSFGGAIVLARPTGGPSIIYRLTLGDNRFTRLGTVGSAGPCVLDPHGDLYIHDAGLLKRFRLDETSATLVGQFPMSLAPAAIACDDSTRQIVALHDQTRSLTFVNADLSGSTTEPLPTGVQIVGTPSLFANSFSGGVFVASGDVNAIFRLARNAAGGLVLAERIAEPSIINPRNIHVDHRGSIAFNSRGELRTIARSTTGAWEPDRNAPLAGNQVGSLTSLAAARDATPEWQGLISDVDLREPGFTGPEIPDCVADVDGGMGNGIPDGGVGIEDLLFYLSLYDAGVRDADVDDGSATGTPDGGVGIEDLLYFLDRYDAGC